MFQGKCSQENVISGICLELRTGLRDSTNGFLQELESRYQAHLPHHLKPWSMGERLVRLTDLPLFKYEAVGKCSVESWYLAWRSL